MSGRLPEPYSSWRPFFPLEASLFGLSSSCLPFLPLEPRPLSRLGLFLAGAAMACLPAVLEGRACLPPVLAARARTGTASASSAGSAAGRGRRSARRTGASLSGAGRAALALLRGDVAAILGGLRVG